MSDISIVSAQLQAGDPVAGVTLEAYVKCERANRPVYLACVDSENDGKVLDSANATLQFRWLRSSECIENTACCHFHPDRKATLCCGFWKADLIAHGYMFAHACHCSVECFSSQFHVQRQYWERAQAAKQRSVEGERLSCCCSSRQRRYQLSQRFIGCLQVMKRAVVSLALLAGWCVHPTVRLLGPSWALRRSTPLARSM